jgi:hypothetical protein
VQSPSWSAGPLEALKWQLERFNFTFDNVTALNAVERDFGFAPLSLKTYLARYGQEGID